MPIATDEERESAVGFEIHTPRIFNLSREAAKQKFGRDLIRKLENMLLFHSIVIEITIEVKWADHSGTAFLKVYRKQAGLKLESEESQK